MRDVYRGMREALPSTTASTKCDPSILAVSISHLPYCINQRQARVGAQIACPLPSRRASFHRMLCHEY